MRIFISYRRADTSEEAHAIYRFLARKYRKSSVFIDVDTIPKGSDFQTELKAALSRTDILLAMIGQRWLEPSEGGSTPRLFEDGDFVRMEIAEAIKRGIPIVPVVVGGGQRPEASQVPPNTMRVHRNRPFYFDNRISGQDCSRLDWHLRRHRRRRHRLWPRLVASVSATAVVLALVVPTLLIPTESARSDLNPNPDPYLGPGGAPIPVLVTAGGKLQVPNNLPFDMAAVLKQGHGGSSYGISLKAEKDASMKSVSSIADALVYAHFRVHIDLPAQ